MAVQMLERRARSTVGRDVSGFFSALRHLDVLLVASALCLSGIGLVMVYSATESTGDPGYFLKRQLIYVLLGIVAMVVMMTFDYRRLEEWSAIIYILAILALLAVRVVGSSNLGSVREISVGPLAIQPSEFAVFAVIVAVATFLHRHDAELSLGKLARLAALVGPLLALILLEPDLGTTLVAAITVVTMIVVGGVRLRYLALLVLGMATLVLIGSKVHLLHSFQSDRISGFLHQSRCNQSTYASQQPTCYQYLNARAAIGAGGLTGTGLFQGALTKTGFVPEQYADFIFSAIGEQLGFIGSLAVIGLFGALCLRIMRGVQVARDTLGRLICAGALGFVAFSVFQNIGMNVGIMPITGIPLPFISYGGSALFATFAAIGLVANVQMRRYRAR